MHRTAAQPLWVAAATAAILALIPGSAAAQKSGVAPNVISLPKGPASVSGLGETFKPDLNTGSASYRVPIRLPKGVGGLTPSLALSYASGRGNSAAGFGWSLGIPQIRVRTEKGVPRYDGGDIYRLSGVGSGELVPLPSGYYQLEVEGAFIRARKTESGWEVRDKSGRIYRFGTTPESRVAADGKTAAWYLTDWLDPLGNRVSYRYEKDGGRPYLATIRYNDFSPGVAAEVQLTYEARPDALASYRTGFRVVTARRLVRVEAKVGERLVSRYVLRYAADAPLSRLVGIEMVGTDGVTALPELRLDYHAFDPDAAQIVTMASPPGVSPSAAQNSLVDLDGDGFPDLLATEKGRFTAYLNDGGTGWRAPQIYDDSPSIDLSQDGVRLADIDGNGRVDLVAKLADVEGGFRYYPSLGPVGFSRERALAPSPGFDFADRGTKLLDVTGDGRSDVVQSTAGQLYLFENDGAGGFGAAKVLPPIDPTMTLDFADGAHVRFADLNGDGLVDVVHVREEGIVYWPQRGYGRFAAPVTMAGAPRLTSLEWVHVRDVNGDGLADVVRVGVTEVEYWLNQANGSFGARQVITGVPYRDPSTTTVRFADMNGNGSTDVVWVDLSGSPAESWRYLDLLGDNRPGLMRRIDNGLGKVVTIAYSSSGTMSAEARRAGQPWVTELPMPTQVVSRITVDDSLGNRQTTEMVYRDGYYDGAEREFRGFASATVRQIGDAHTPTLTTESRFHTGEGDQALKGRLLGRTVMGGAGEILREERRTYEVALLVQGDNGAWVRHARPTVIEVDHVEGQSVPATVLTELEYDHYGNVIVRKEWGRVIGGDPAGGDDERITRTDYAINREDWIVDRAASVSVEDGDGQIQRRTRLHYDGADFEGLGLGGVQRGLLKRKAAWLAAEDRWIPVGRYAHDAYGNLVAARDARGFTRHYRWDEETHRFPTAERLVIGPSEIERRAEYDQTQGVVLRYVDENEQETRFRYDALGRLVATISPGDSDLYPTVSYAYQLGSPISSVWEHVRATAGEETRLTRVTHYDGLGRARSRRQEAEEDQWVEQGAKIFDARGQVALTYRPYFVTGSGYEAPDAAMPGTEHFRDALGRAVREVLPDGAESRASYLPLASLSWDANDTDPNSPHYETPTRRERDGLGREIRLDVRVGAETHTRRVVWTTAGQITALIDAEGHQRTHRYDSLGRLVETDDPNAGRWRYRYDDAGALLEREDPRGQIVRHEYDEAGRQQREIHVDTSGAASTYATYHYDRPWPGHGGLSHTNGRLGWVEHPGGVQAFGYDARGHAALVVREIGGQQFTVRRAFDSAGRLTAITYPDGARLPLTYNPRSLVSAAGGIVTAQRYGAGGELLSRDWGNGVRSQRSYDAQLRLVSIRSQNAAALSLQVLDVRYDGVGNILEVADGRPGIAPERSRSVTATYDARDRMVRAVGPDFDLQWRHSPAGKLLAISGTAPVAAQVTGELRHGEDGAGPHAMTSLVAPGGEIRRFAYDAAGNLVRTPDAELRYDARGQVTSVIAASGARVDSTYDHTGARVVRTVRHPGGREEHVIYGGRLFEIRGGELIKYVVIGGERVARIGELPRAGEESIQSAIVAPPGANTAPGAGQGLLLALLLLVWLAWPRPARGRRPAPARRRIGARVLCAVGAVAVLYACGQSPTEKQPPAEVLDRWPASALAILVDHQGSQHLLVNAWGNIVNEQVHLPYGVRRYVAGRTAAIHGYAGRERDGDTGLIAIGARQLLGGYGLWNRPDPLMLHDPQAAFGEGLSGNLYAYVEWNPLSRVDLDGFKSRSSTTKTDDGYAAFDAMRRRQQSTTVPSGPLLDMAKAAAALRKYQQELAGRRVKNRRVHRRPRRRTLSRMKREQNRAWQARMRRRARTRTHQIRSRQGDLKNTGDNFRRPMGDFPTIRNGYPGRIRREKLRRHHKVALGFSNTYMYVGETIRWFPGAGMIGSWMKRLGERAVKEAKENKKLDGVE